MMKTEMEKMLYFLAEQAVCLAQERPKESDVDFTHCRELFEFLADGDQDALHHFDERTGKVKLDPTGLEDYDIENYDGKRTDMQEAVTALLRRGNEQETPERLRPIFTQVAADIACFYGGGALTTA